MRQPATMFLEYYTLHDDSYSFLIIIHGVFPPQILLKNEKRIVINSAIRQEAKFDLPSLYKGPQSCVNLDRSIKFGPKIQTEVAFVPPDCLPLASEVSLCHQMSTLKGSDQTTNDKNVLQCRIIYVSTVVSASDLSPSSQLKNNGPGQKNCWSLLHVDPLLTVKIVFPI